MHTCSKTQSFLWFPVHTLQGLRDGAQETLSARMLKDPTRVGIQGFQRTHAPKSQGFLTFPVHTCSKIQVFLGFPAESDSHFSMATSCSPISSFWAQTGQIITDRQTHDCLRKLQLQYKSFFCNCNRKHPLRIFLCLPYFATKGNSPETQMCNSVGPCLRH